MFEWNLCVDEDGFFVEKNILWENMIVGLFVFVFEN